MRAQMIVRLILLTSLAVGCASDISPEKVAELRAMEAESATRLAAEGELLYGANSTKLNGYEYCRLAGGLSEQGEFRRAIREASKALYLGQASNDACLEAFAKRDLSVAYSWAGHLDRGREFASEALRDANACRTPASITVPSNKVLGDVHLLEGRPGEAIPHYERACPFGRPA